MIINDMDFYYMLQNEAVERDWEFYQSEEGGDLHLVTGTNHYINEQIDKFLFDYPELQNLYRHMIVSK